MNIHKKCLFILFASLLFNQSYSQQIDDAPKSFVFSWDTPTQDQFEIPVENNLEVTIKQHFLNRALTMILIKSLMNSINIGKYETFTPIQIHLTSESDFHVAELEFTTLGKFEEELNLTFYYSFDENGNVFGKLD